MLKSTGEGDGSMLDRTIVVYGSGMNSGAGGEHSPKNLPLLVAGGRKLGVKLGHHIAHNVDKHPPQSNVLLSLIQKTGVETTSSPTPPARSWDWCDCQGAGSGVRMADERPTINWNRSSL